MSLLSFIHSWILIYWNVRILCTIIHRYLNISSFSYIYIYNKQTFYLYQALEYFDERSWVNVLVDRVRRCCPFERQSRFSTAMEIALRRLQPSLLRDGALHYWSPHSLFTCRNNLSTPLADIPLAGHVTKLTSKYLQMKRASTRIDFLSYRVHRLSSINCE